MNTYELINTKNNIKKPNLKYQNMDFEELEFFLKKKMSMTHIYQPSMIKTLLENKGIATTEEIASNFLGHDHSQLKYYKHVVKKWPHRTLKKHNIVSYQRDTYTLRLDSITDEEKKLLIEICDSRINQFIDNDPWIMKLREMDIKSISESNRFAILSKAKGRCLACGKSSAEALLHVDHIIPRSLGGKTEINNLQVLCSQCNQGKSNRDDTDFIHWAMRMKYRKKHCRLCDPKNPITSNELACAIKDKNSKNMMHSWVFPKRHTETPFFDLIPAEKNHCLDLVSTLKEDIMKNDESVKGVNLKFDLGQDQHQHCCIHIIPYSMS